MELQIGTDEFSRALYRAQGIVEKKSTMPILASVLLEATEDGRLRVSAFDLEIGVTGTHPCEVRTGGSVALKHKELYDIVRSLPEKTLVLRREANNRVRMTSGAAEFNIVGQPAEDYRSEEHTSELQSQSNLVCRLLLEKKKKKEKARVRHDSNNASNAWLR